MPEGSEVEARAAAGPPGRMGLGDLACWVAGAAAAAAAMRQPHWRDEAGVAATWPILGLALTPIAAALAVVLVRSIVRGWAGGGRNGRAGLTWRMAAAGLVGLFLAAQGRALRHPPIEWIAPQTTWIGFPAFVKLTPACGLLALLGLTLGLAPAPARPEGRRRPGLIASTATVALAGLAGLLMVGLFAGPLVHFVLIAVEAVYLYHTGVEGLRPPFDRRMVAALPALGVAAAACVAAGTWITRALRPAGDEPSGPGRLGGAAAALSLLLAGGSAACLVRVTLPALSPELAAGLGTVLTPRLVAGLLLSTSLLAAGLAARGTAPGPIRPPDSRPLARRLSALAGWVLLAGGLIGVTVLASLAALRAAFPETAPLDGSLLDFSLLGSIDLNPMLRDGWPVNPAQALAFVLDPERWPTLVGLGWLVALLVAAAWRRARPAAFDAVLADRALTTRFLGRWAALAVLLPSALATLGVASLVLNHFALLALGR